MFLTRKARRKIRLLVGVYCGVGAFCFTAYVVFSSLRIDCTLLAVLSAICLVMAVLVRAVGRYAESKGNLINSGNKLVFHQLRPAEFVRLYEEKRDYPDNVEVKPDYEVLSLLVAAYDTLGDSQREMETLDLLLSTVSEKKKDLVKLAKAGVLYSIGRPEEAEWLYNEVRGSKMSPIVTAMSDILMKSDRALALGDLNTAETYFRQRLVQTFPKTTPLQLLTAHFHLAKICCMTQRVEEAKSHLIYCTQNGGETSMRAEAAEMLSHL